ncbi:hypothetical protein E3N88_36621 [Mikania micrantha]|uniref:FAD-binding domain-containing protein n=1 Tax=Mikania micrantha TaxID=192012 RepID=A0A5N6M4S4_9ASTR|nr:hypothetical protein E3N88_36621 [Mikania micrantha]
MKESKGRAVVVGGSIAGVSAVHALLSAGWEVVVVEKTTAPPTGSSTGAGLGLDPLAQTIINSWLPHQQSDHLLNIHTLALTIDQVFISAIVSPRFQLTSLIQFTTSGYILWGHVFQSFCVSDDNKSVKVQTKVLQTGDIVEVAGTQATVLGEGLDLSDDENSDVFAGLQKVYQDLGKCLYFDLGSGTHAVFYELLNRKINWICMIKKMQEEAEKTWVPELVRVIKATKEPFLNVIYDCDPFRQIVWDHVVLIGDAAHPTTPHGLRSTNMSILDAAVLGQCLMKFGIENLAVGLEEYQSVRLPVTSKQVLHSRKMGRMKQGLVLADGQVFDPKTATPQECQDLQQKRMPGFNDLTRG